jgi:hypothetical protein
MQPHTNIDAYLVLGFGFGIVLFFRGLRTFRTNLVVADTPVIPIRAVAMGIAQVHGHAGGETPFPSPVSGTPCYAFRVKIERYVGRNGWTHHRTDQNGKRFYLADETGRILVDPREAEFDVPVNCRRQVGDPPVTFSLASLIHAFPLNAYDDSDVSATAKTDNELLEYAGVGYGCVDAFRFTEYCIEPDNDYDVLGTCIENPKPEGQQDRNLITKGTHDSNFLISSRTADQLKQGIGWRSTMMVIGGAGLVIFCAALSMSRHGLF